MDRDHLLISSRLYRENCVQLSEDLYVKDLRILGRDLKDVIIVDNTPYAFAAQLDNGYPIVPFYDDKEDCELERFQIYLEELKAEDDIRVMNKQKFKLSNLSGLGIEEYAQYYRQTEKEKDTGKKKEVEESVEFAKLQQALKSFFKDPA